MDVLTTRLSKASERFSWIQITFIWIRFWRPPIARRTIFLKRLRSTPKPRRQRICRVAALLSPMRGWAGKPMRENILAQLFQAREKRYVSAPLIAAVSTALGDKEEAFRGSNAPTRSIRGCYSGSRFFPNFARSIRTPAFPNFYSEITASHETILTITETTLSETTDPKAQSHFTLKVGVRPRPGTPNGHAVRMVVSFYDLTKITS